NLCFGGPKYKTLFITGQPLVTSIPLRVAGTPAIKSLQYSFNGSQLILSWPAPSTGFVLQQTDQLDPPASWTNSDLVPITNNSQKQVSVDVTNAANFFRLQLP